MVSFYIFLEEISVMNLSLIRPIEPVIDENHSEMHGLVPFDRRPRANYPGSGVRGYLEVGCPAPVAIPSVTPWSRPVQLSRVVLMACQSVSAILFGI